MFTEYWLWLAAGMGPCANIQPVLQQFKTAELIYQNRTSLFGLGLCTAAQAKRLAATSLQAMSQLVQKHQKNGYGIVCYDDADYPAALRCIDTPPPVLYYKGDITVCNIDTLHIGMVGARNPSAYGVEAAKLISAQLAACGTVLVSGLAAGLDSEAHKAAVNADVPTIAVIGTAIDVCYPAANATLRRLIEQNGVVLSEYAMGTKNYPAYFVQRNRLIAALSKGLCVVEAKMRSGTMSTVNFALEYGRDIFSVPGSIFSSLSQGTNHLISQGAKPVCSATDIFEEYGIKINKNINEAQANVKASQQQPGLDLMSDTEKAVYNMLGITPQDLASICKKINLSPAKAMSAITMLEIGGFVKQLPGRKFCKAI